MGGLRGLTCRQTVGVGAFSPVLGARTTAQPGHRVQAQGGAFEPWASEQRQLLAATAAAVRLAQSWGTQGPQAVAGLWQALRVAERSCRCSRLQAQAQAQGWCAQQQQQALPEQLRRRHQAELRLPLMKQHRHQQAQLRASS